MPLGNVIMLAAVLAAMWFLLIRPQQQRQREHQRTVATLTAGQRIVTIGGLVAEIVEVRGDRVLVRVADGSEMEFMKDAVGRTLPAEDIDAESDDDVDEDDLAETEDALDETAPDATDVETADDADENVPAEGKDAE